MDHQVSLATVRRGRGLTQRLLALAADVPLGTISAVEGGYRSFSLEQKDRIARVLSIGETDTRLVRELAP